MAHNRTNPGTDRKPKAVPHDIQEFAHFLDSRFKIGNFRFGIDPILGLIPGIGDFIALFLSGGIVALAGKNDASGKLLVIMSLNVFLDAVIGSIPVVGGIFDFFYKANNRNLKLLEKHYQEGKYHGSGKGLVIIIILVLLAVTVVAIYLIWELVSYLLALI